ncbi:glutathione S-transferase T3-like [Helianthus annuus]|uniref:glutathione S-transferase T3-like n=1 Tax=Helianthus annuus TaxID=4232 RepID=UPI000B8FDA79|nr:glutathione S-transferase T3-like [Helianthus annuus]
MFPNNQNPLDPNNPFWQTLQNNEQEDRYRRDPRTGELGYYPMPPSTPTSPHPTTPPMPGNDQDLKVFWGRIHEKFFAAMGRGEYRTPNSFSGKWGAMRTKVTNFNNIYTNLVNSSRRKSGASDVDVMTQAHNDYRLYHGHVFTLVSTWELLRESPKWHLVPPFDPTRPRSKRSKLTSTTEPSGSDVRTIINLNDDADEFEEPEELPRPTGRHKSKAVARGKSSTTLSDGPSKLSDFNASLNNLISNREKDQQMIMEKQIQKDMDFLARDLSNLPEENRVILKARKAQIWATYM